MKIAVIGSRGLRVNNLEKYLQKNTTEIVSGVRSALIPVLKITLYRTK